jgi:hypothetical protein
MRVCHAVCEPLVLALACITIDRTNATTDHTESPHASRLMRCRPRSSPSTASVRTGDLIVRLKLVRSLLTPHRLPCDAVWTALTTTSPHDLHLTSLAHLIASTSAAGVRAELASFTAFDSSTGSAALRCLLVHSTRCCVRQSDHTTQHDRVIVIMSVSISSVSQSTAGAVATTNCHHVSQTTSGCMRSGAFTCGVTAHTDPQKRQEDEQQLQAAENQLSQLKMNAVSKKEDIPSAAHTI